MTEKQEQILKTALQLFAEKGYDGTSTAKVAKAAGVSEGLIFQANPTLLCEDRIHDYRVNFKADFDGFVAAWPPNG